MARKKTVQEPNEEIVVGVLDQIIAVEQAEQEAPIEIEEIPVVGTEEWSTFLLSKLKEDEVFNGCPNVEGLRRICQEYYGDVVSSVSSVVQAPNAHNGNHACVVHTIAIEGRDGIVRQFSGVADVFGDNTDNAMFSWQYSSATCETRAESRAYRRALRLRHVVAQEEICDVPIDDSGAFGYMSDSQRNFLSVNGRRLNLNIMKYLSSGKQRYERANQVPYEVAQKAFAHLQQFIQDPSKIKPEWKGYDENWAQ